MTAQTAAPHSATRLFAVFAAVGLVPVVVLGFVLAGSYRSEANRRGLDEATSESALIASTAVEPVLFGQDLRLGLSAHEQTQLFQVAQDGVAVKIFDSLGKVRDTFTLI